MDNWTCAWCTDKRAPCVCTNCGPECPECGHRSNPFGGLSGFDRHQELIDDHPGVLCHDPATSGLWWNADRRGPAAWSEPHSSQR